MLRLVIIIFILLLFSPDHSFAQNVSTKNDEAFFKGVVTQTGKERKEYDNTAQTVILQLDKKNQQVSAQYVFRSKNSEQKLSLGEKVVVTAIKNHNNTNYSVYDRYRLPTLLILIAIFFVLILITTGKRGLGAIAGLIISLFTILLFIVPQILHGANPLFISIVGCLFIMITTIYLAHGFSQRTSVAVLGTFLSLALTGILAIFFVQLLKLTGGGNEDAYMLQFGVQNINLQGLLLGSIMIGTLGVLDDTTTTQAATVYALAEANNKLRTKDLIQSGMVVGREHITSLVNTLVLAYAGASLPIFIFLVLNPLHQPIWAILNNEMIVEEIVRTLAGSIGLILAVPITTILAAFFCKYSIKIT